MDECPPFDILEYDGGTFESKVVNWYGLIFAKPQLPGMRYLVSKICHICIILSCFGQYNCPFISIIV